MSSQDIRAAWEWPGAWLPTAAGDAAIMRQGRWRSPAMVVRYTRGEEAGKALAYL